MGAINLARLSELQWRAPPPKRRPWGAFMLICLGLAIGYHLLHSDSSDKDAASTPTALVGASGEAPLAAGQERHNEMSSIAAAGASPELAHYEAPTTASVPPEVRVINPPREDQARQSNPALDPGTRSVGKERGYASLRRDFLSHLR
jgi:hypothetical protein